MRAWSVIVEFASPATADELFEEWKREHSEIAGRLAPDDIRIDTGQGKDGQIRRYRVRLPEDGG